MARFSVYANPEGAGYLLDVDGQPHVMVTQFMAAVPARLLQSHVMSLDDRAHEVMAALDCLFQGI